MNTPETWLLLESGADAAAVNMATDHALLESVGHWGRPILRFYGWTEPAASFGYFQHYREIEAATRLRPLVRRPTGGGLVPHDADWTYSLAFPPGHWWFELPAVESYRRIHHWLKVAFGRLDIDTELAPCCRKELPGQCFAGYELHDLLRHGRKMAGAAQRRSREGLLIQGSVQPPPRLPCDAWESAMRDVAAVPAEAVWPASVKFESLAVDERFQHCLTRLLDERYSRAEHHTRR